MKRKLNVIIERKGNMYEARCPEMPDAFARGHDKNDALEKLRDVITRILGDDSNGGSAATPRPVSPSPRGPIIFAESNEKPDAS